jgi:L-aspartate oxidase
MECLVFARKMSAIVLNDLHEFPTFDRSFQEFDIEDPKEDQISKIAEKIDELRKLCWLNLGVSRNKVNMSKFLNFIQDDINKLHKNALLNSLEKIKFDQKIKLSERNRRALNLLLDLKNRQITTITLLKACLFREESRGGHFRDDFPNKDKHWECHTRQQLDQKIQKRFIKN